MLQIQTIIQTQPICDRTTSSLVCNNGLIQIISANYGRLSTNQSICVSGSITSSYSTALCYSNQTTLVGNLCNNYSSCSITPSKYFFQIDPCVLTFKYLSIQYQCTVDSTTSTTTSKTTTATTTTTTITTSTKTAITTTTTTTTSITTTIFTPSSTLFMVFIF